jgi:seryl-tRNA synthetase
MQAKEDASGLKEQSITIKKQIAEAETAEQQVAAERDETVKVIGNLVHDSVPVHDDEARASSIGFSKSVIDGNGTAATSDTSTFIQYVHSYKPETVSCVAPCLNVQQVSLFELIDLTLILSITKGLALLIGQHAVTPPFLCILGCFVSLD